MYARIYDDAIDEQRKAHTAMKALAGTIRFKIVLTFAWAGVPLLAPRSFFAWAGVDPVPEPMVLVRLLGMAYAALLVGYVLTLRALRHDGLSAAVRNGVWMGVVSNGGAAAVLVVCGVFFEAYATWHWLAQGVMWASAVLTAGIAAALGWFGLR